MNMVDRLAIVCLTTVSAALGEAKAAVSWTDYFGNEPPTSSKVTIREGDEVIVNDSEMEAFKNCTVTIADGATLKLDTSTFPTFTLAESRGGTVEKVYAGDWAEASKNQANFKGSYVINSGAVNIHGSHSKVFGAVDSLDSATLYATNGAVIAYNGKSSYLGSIPINLAGSMTFNKTTFSESVFRFLTLEGDSSLKGASAIAATPNAATAFVDRHDEDNPSFINLNGYSFTVGEALDLTLKNGSFKGPGNIKVNGGTSSETHLLHLENFGMEGCGANDVFEFGQYSGLSTTTALTIPRKVKICDASTKFHGPGWTVFAGGLDGEAAIVDAFVTNVVGDGMAAFPGRSIVNDSQAIYTYSSIDEEALWIGHCATGGLWVTDGMALTSKLVIGGDSNAKKYQIGCGTLRQSGGDVCMIGTPDSTVVRNGSAIGWSAHGYYEIAGGTAKLVGNLMLGMASPGIIAQYGGVFEQLAHPLTPSTPPDFYFSYAANDTDANQIPSVIYVGGGTMRLARVFLSHGNAAQSVITVSGKNSLFETPERIYFGFNAGSKAWVNVNDGGVLALPYFQYRNDVDAQIYVNIDGGTLRIMPKVLGSSELMTIFGNPADTTRPQVTRVTIGSKGAAIDTASRDMSVDVSMVPAYGNVVSAIPFAPETGWTVAPYVKIVDEEGEGEGATAFADFDSATGTLSGFRITSGGWNYTSAKAQIYVNKTIVREIECTLAEALGAGPFTKKGEGTLSLTASNAWSGATIVEAGTLKADAEGAIPDGTALRLNGGTLDMNGYEATFASIGGTDGTISNGAANYTVETLDPATTADLDLSGVTLTVTGNVTIAAADLMAGKFPVYRANIVFGEGSSITVANPEELLRTKTAYTLIRAQGGSIAGLPRLVNADALPGWSCTNRGAALKLGVPIGFIVNVR